MSKKLALAIMLSAMLSSVALAEDQQPSSNETLVIPELVITANRVETQLDNIGRSIDTRDQSELLLTGAENLSDSLQTVAGVHSVELGGPSVPGLTPIEVRGFRNGGTKLLLNGMTLDDPSSISGSYEGFYSYMSTADIQRVEVLKGGAGVLYGSEAQAGAVNLITVRPTEGINGSLSAEGGSHDTFAESVLLNAGVSDAGVVGSVYRKDTSGLHRHGGLDETTTLVNTYYDVVPETLRISPMVRVTEANMDLDTSPTLDAEGNLITNQPTAKNNVDSDAYFVGISSDYIASSHFSSKLNVYYNDTERNYLFDFDGFESLSDYEGSSLHVDQQNTAKLEEINSEVVFGMDYAHQEVDLQADTVTDSQQRDQTAFYVHDRTGFLDDALQLAGGARATIISDIGKTVPTLEGSAVYKIKESGTRFHSSIAEGFRAPTLFETRGHMQDYNTGEVRAVGNDDLDEEESLSWDAGVEQAFFDNNLVLDTTFFMIDSDQTIVFDYANYKYENGGGGNTQGIEFSALAKPVDWYTSRLAYTYLGEAEDIDGTRRQRTPWNWTTWENIFTYGDVSVSGMLRYRGAQEVEIYGISDRYNEGSATVFDAMVSYHVIKDVELYLKGENLFDAHYTEGGYQMPGAGCYAGLKISFM